MRYADDAIIHCKSKAQAESVLQLLHQRMADCELELHPEKTKLVYCRDFKRQGSFKTVKFEFLGYELSRVFYLLRIRLVRWARKRYKRYRNSLNKAYQWLDRVRKQYPYLFYHWQLGFSH